MNMIYLDEHLNSATSIVLSLWFSSPGLAAVAGNAVVLWLFNKKKSQRTISNCFLASLSVVDFLARLVVHPLFTAGCLSKSSYHSGAIIRYVLWMHSIASTAFNLCCVSADRLIEVRFPFRYQEIVATKRCY